MNPGLLDLGNGADGASEDKMDRLAQILPLPHMTSPLIARGLQPKVLAHAETWVSG